MKEQYGRKRLFLKILLLAAAASGAAALFFACFSPFAVRMFWLPYLAETAGLTASAGKAEIRFSWRRPLLSVRDLQLKDARGNEIRIGTGECRFSLLELLAGKADIGDVLLRDSAVFIRKLPEFPARRSGHELPRIGSCRIENLQISPAPELSRQLSSVTIGQLTLTGFHPSMENELKSDCLLRFSGGAELPLKAEISLSPGQDGIMPDIGGWMRIMPGKGALADRNIETALGTVFFYIRRQEKMPAFVWNMNAELAGLDFAEYLKIFGKGEITETFDRGTAELHLKTSLSRPEICRLCPSLAGFVEMIPEGLQVPDWLLQLRLEGDTLFWTTDGKLEWACLRMNGKPVLGKGASSIRQSGRYDFKTEIFSFHGMKLELKSGDTSFLCETPEKNTVTLTPDGFFRWKTHRAPIVIRAKNIPVPLLDPLFPVDFSGGSFSLNYDGVVDAEKKRIDGRLDMDIASVSVDFEDGRFLDSHDVSIRMKLQSDGLEDIETFAVESCRISASKEGREFLTGTLSGSFRFDDSALSLGGKLVTTPYEMLGLIRDPLAEMIRKKTAETHAEHTKNISSVNISFDPRKSEHLSWSLQTGFDTLSMLGSGFAGKTLRLSLRGSARRENAASGEIRIADASLSAPGLLNLNGAGKISFPAGKLDLSLQLKELSPDLWKGCAMLFFPEVFDESDLAPFGYSSLRGGTDFTLNPSDHSIRIRKFQLELVPTASSDATEQPSAKLMLDRDYLFSYEDPSRSECRMILISSNFPVAWFNMFFPRYVPYRFLSGTGHATMEVTAKNLFRHIFLNVDVTGEEYSFSACDGTWRIEDVHIDGTVGLTDYFRSFLFKDLRVVCSQKNELLLEGMVNGKIGLWDKAPTSLQFRIDRTGPLYPAALFGGFMEELPSRTFESTGLFTYEAEDKFEDSTFYGQAKIGNWVFENAPDALALHGDAAIRVEFRPDNVRFRKCGVNLVSPDNGKIFNCFFDGDFRNKEEKTGNRCSLVSDGMDLAFFLRTLFYRKSSASLPAPPSGEKNTAEKSPAPLTAEEMRERNAPWPFRTEPPPLHIFEDPTTLSVDLRNVRCTDFLTMNLEGTCQAAGGRIQSEKLRFGINDAQAHLKFKTDLSAGEGCEYEGELHAANLSATSVILAAAELKQAHFPGEQLKGVIQALHLKLRGKGISLKKLDENLELSGTLAIDRLSVPFDARGSSILLKILLLPIEHIPRLIGFIPQEQIRLFLQRLMGEEMEILTGQRAIDFDTGTVELVSDHTDLHIRKMYFSGPHMRFRVERGYFNPFYNEMNVDSLSRFTSVNYPLRFTGSIDNPAIDIPRFLALFLNRNTFQILNNTVKLVTFGLAGDAESEWMSNAEITMRH